MILPEGSTPVIYRYLIIAAFMATVACNPQGAQYEDELDLVLSIENNDVNYQDYQTYVIADSIEVLGQQGEVSIDPANQQFVIDEIRDHLNEAGWTESSDPMQNGSDVIVLVSVLENVNFAVGGWWDYWGDWGGWGWYPPYPPGGYYPGYPGYCCYSSIYAYREGSLIIEMFDPNNPLANDQLEVLWSGAINALIDGRSNLRSRVERGIDRMFTDSPYLHKN